MSEIRTFTVRYHFKSWNFLTFFAVLSLWVIFALLDPVPGPDPADQNQCGYIRIRIHNTDRKVGTWYKYLKVSVSACLGLDHVSLGNKVVGIPSKNNTHIKTSWCPNKKATNWSITSVGVCVTSITQTRQFSFYFMSPFLQWVWFVTNMLFLVLCVLLLQCCEAEIISFGYGSSEPQIWIAALAPAQDSF